MGRRHPEALREEIGKLLVRGVPEGTQEALARSLGVTTRTLRSWKKRAESARCERRPVGRPRRDEAVRALALRRIRALLREEPWLSARAVHRALQGELSLALVLEIWKAVRDEKARALRAWRAREGQHTSVLARDTLWALDGTHLGRDPDGDAVIAELVRDVASSATLGTSLGGPATSKEVVRLLRRVRRSVEALPLVLALDNGPENQGALLRWCASNQVLLLRNLPHTPEHNPCVEHGHGELKAVSGLGKGVRIDALPLANAAVLLALAHVDGVRRRPTRGMRTAREAYAEMPRAQALVERRRFYEETDCAMRKAVESSTSKREGTTGRAPRRPAGARTTWTGHTNTRTEAAAARDRGRSFVNTTQARARRLPARSVRSLCQNEVCPRRRSRGCSRCNAAFVQ